MVADEHVDPEFGTGAVKVTGATTQMTYEIGFRHQLPMISIMDTEGEINDTGTQFDGMDRFQARAAVREALADEGRQVSSRRSGRTYTASDTPSAAASRSNPACPCSGGSGWNRLPRPPATRCATGTP